MYSKLSALLLFTAFVSPAAGILNWNVAKCPKETLKDVEDGLTHLILHRNDGVPPKNLNIVGLEIFNENSALVIIMVTKSEFYTYRVNLKNNLLEGTRFGASTLEKIKIAAEMYAKINFIVSFDERKLAEHQMHLTKEGLLKAIDLWHIETSNKDALVVEKCAALVAFDDGSFGFAPYIRTKTYTNDGKTSSYIDKFLVLGYSQKCESESLAKQGLHAYLCNDDSFGRIPLLPALYSGSEDLAKVAVDEKTKELYQKINGNEEKPQYEVKVLRAWSIAKHTLCVAVCSMERYYGFLHFFVIYDSGKDGNNILLNKLRRIGSLGWTEFGVMMGLVDYLRPNYISADCVKIELNSISPMAELIYAADIAARKETEHQESSCRIPHILHSIESANLVSERLQNPSSAVCAALLVRRSLRWSSTMDEIGQLFCLKVKSVLDPIGKTPDPRNVKPMEGNMAFLQMLESPAFLGRTMVEGSVMQAPESVLIPLLRERRKKTYLINNNKEDPPSFSIIPVQDETYEYDNIFYSTYILRERTKRQNQFYFRVSITDPYDENAKVVVSEIHEVETSNVVFQMEKKIEKANLLRKDIENIKDKNGIKDKKLTKDPSNGNSNKILMRCLEYAARKHVHNERKDYQKTPYVNHSIGVARILVLEGCVDDLELVMAAILHETLEYTTATKEELIMMFGEKIAQIVADVAEVTDDKVQSIVDKTQSPAVVLVRLADRIYNLRDLDRQCPPEFSEARRRSQFTSTSELISRFEFNYTNNLWWQMFPKYKDAFAILLRILQSILESHQNSLMAPVDFTTQVNGTQG